MLEGGPDAEVWCGFTEIVLSYSSAMCYSYSVVVKRYAVMRTISCTVTVSCMCPRWPETQGLDFEIWWRV